VCTTLPLGVLKAVSVGFEPPLPAAKQAAVNDMVRGQALPRMLLLLPFWLWLGVDADIMPGTTQCTHVLMCVWMENGDWACSCMLSSLQQQHDAAFTRQSHYHIVLKLLYSRAWMCWTRWCRTRYWCQ
jgi:hypothetical protein